MLQHGHGCALRQRHGGSGLRSRIVERGLYQRADVLGQESGDLADRCRNRVPGKSKGTPGGGMERTVIIVVFVIIVVRVGRGNWVIVGWVTDRVRAIAHALSPS